jgi:hypothetical protein
MFISEENADFEWGEQFRYTWVAINSILYTVLVSLMLLRYLAMVFVDIK